MTFAEVQHFAGRRRCAICKGLLEVVVRDGQYVPFCPGGRGEHETFELLPSKEKRFAEHEEAVAKLAPRADLTKEDIFGKGGY